MKSAMVLSLALAAAVARSQEVKMTEPTLTCAIEQFSPGLGKAGEFKKCAALKDTKEQPTKSITECKDRAVEKAKACLTKAGIAKVAVTGKYTEKFDIRSQSTKFTCEVDNKNGVSCP